MRFIRVKDLEKKIALKKTAIYNLINRGLLPPPRKLGKVSFWVEDEIDRIMTALAKGLPEEVIRAEVKSLKVSGTVDIIK